MSRITASGGEALPVLPPVLPPVRPSVLRTVRRRRLLARLLPVLAAAALQLAAAGPALAASPVPFPAPQPGTDVRDYSQLHIAHGSCAPPFAGAAAPAGRNANQPAGSDLPPSFDCKGANKLTDYAAQPGDDDYDPTVAGNPQEFLGVKGAGTNRAWEKTTGRPDTVISVMDSGIIWTNPTLVDKVELNRGELPPPCAAAPCDETRGDVAATYDRNGDGIFSVSDYAGDPRVLAAVPAAAGRGYLTPEDLIRTFSDGIDHDGNGYRNDIAGWDFYQHDNDPADDVTYGHGTGEAKDSTEQVTATSFSQCPNCRVLPLRVGDSFIADVNHFAAAVTYAVDNGASVVQEALGTLNHTGFAQRALDYAYSHGVLVVASEADESAGHHNYPAALNHTMVVNSVTHFVAGAGPVAAQNPKTYLAFNGCTNFGGYTWVSVESNSCSSDATGQSAGIAGLLYSAARNEVQAGRLAPDASGRPLSAEEAKQLFRLAADDIDFTTPKPPGPALNFGTTLPDSARFVTTPGWDQISGWGRLSSRRLVDLVTSDAIPAEADITSPGWWAPLGTTGTVPVVGRVAAPRAASYTYAVQVAPGVQPPPVPGGDTWTTVTTGGGTAPRSGVLATLDLAQVRGMINAAVPAYTPVNDPTSRSLPESDSFRVRVVVHPSSGPDGIEQRQYYSSADATRVAGWPRNLDADITGAAFADLTGDGRDEMIVADGNGLVHAFRADGSEAPGFPAATDVLDYLPTTGSNAFTSGAMSGDVHGAVLLGSPLVVDLDHTGRPSVAVTDLEGKLYVFDATGHRRPGFPVRTDPRFSHDPGCETAVGPACDAFTPHHVRDHINTVDRAFAATPSAGDLDGDGRPEIVAGAMDDHLYAWHADGSQVDGFPVLLRDPSKVAAVDPVSQRIDFKPDAGVHYGKQIVTTPTIADLDGDGHPEIVVNVNEEYAETPNYSLRTPLPAALGGVLGSGNTRVYAVHGDGTAHPGTERVSGLGDNAYVAGWPARIGLLQLELLPDVGSGSDGSPVVAQVNGRTVIATASVGSPLYLLKPDGTSALGTDPQGHAITASTDPQEFKGDQTDGASFPSLGGATFGRLGGPSSPVSVAMGSTGLKRLLDIVLPEQQLGAEDHLSAWDPTTGTYLPGFPAEMNDLMFFTSPAIADVDGTGTASVIQGSAVYDLRAYHLGGAEALDWPKATYGWVTQTAAVGDVLGDGSLQVAEPTREGNLFLWRTRGSACGDLEWPKFQHDLRNTGDHRMDARPPGALRDVALSGQSLRVRASGNDGYCPGTASSYVVTVDGVPHQLAVAPAAAGTVQTLDLAGIARPGSVVTVSEQDAAGNLSFPVLAGAPSGALPEVGIPVLLPGLAVVLAGVVALRRRRRA